MGGTVGYTIQKTTYTPQTNVVVYNGSVNDPSADWFISSGLFYQCYDDSQDVTLELDGTGIITNGYLYDSYVQFVGRPTLPLFNYSHVSFSVDIKVLQGSAHASIEVNYREWPEIHWHEAGKNTTSLDETQSGTLVLEPSLDSAYNLTSGWGIRTTILLRFTSSEESVIQVGNVIISVKSNENLYPVTFDMQAPDGESLFLNPSMNILRSENYFYSMEYPRYTAIELTRTENYTDSSIYEPRSVNETLYLAEGTYEGVAGWFYDRYKMENSIFNISFTIEPNESVFIAIRIPTFRLYIDINPSFAYSEVWVSDWGTIYRIEYPLQDADYLYMPNGTSFTITVSPIAYESHRFVDYAHYNYRQPSARCTFAANGTSDVRVTVVFSQFSILGIILDWGQILEIVGTALLLLLLIYGGITRGFAGARTNYYARANLLPVSVYYIATFLPWVTYSFNTDAYPPTTIFGVVFVPLYMTIWWSQGSQFTPAPSSYLIPNIIVFAFLYWLPIMYLSYLIATHSNSINSKFTTDEDIAALTLLSAVGVFVIGGYYMTLCATGLCYVNIGLIAALLMLPAWGIAYGLRRRHEKIHAIQS